MKRFKNWLRKKILAFLRLEIENLTVTVMSPDMDKLAEKVQEMLMKEKLKRGVR